MMMGAIMTVTFIAAPETSGNRQTPTLTATPTPAPAPTATATLTLISTS